MVTALERVGDGILGRNDIWGYDPSQPFGEGILIWDVKNPTDPKQLGFFKTGGFGTRRNFYAGGKYTYLAANTKGYRNFPGSNLPCSAWINWNY